MTRKGPSRRTVRTVLGVAVMVSALVFGGFFIPADDAEADHLEAPAGDGEQFVWPTPSWISATDEYPDGAGHHKGSADLSAPHFTPIHPARSGVVIMKRWSNVNGWQLRLLHETDDDSDLKYYTLYAHMAEEPLVDEGDEVDLDTQLGYVGRTGSAVYAGPHIHFVMHVRDGDGPRRLIKIPGLEIGQWARGGGYIPGVFEGLDPIETTPDRSFDVRVTEENVANVYRSTGRRIGEVVAELEAGQEATVLDSDRGQYQVEVDGVTGWIPHTLTQPAGSEVFDVEMSGYPTINVRPEPSQDDDPIGRVYEGDILTAFDVSADGDYFLVLWKCKVATNKSDDEEDDSTPIGGCPDRDKGVSMKYGWVHHPSVANPTDSFVARTRVDDLNVYGNRVVDGENQPDCSCDSDAMIGELGNSRDKVTVLETRNGWHRIDFEGEIGWIRGWYTAGRQ